MRARRTQLWLAGALACAAACASSTSPDPGLQGLSVATVTPGTIIPGTQVVVTGASFVDTQWGAGDLHLVGTANGNQVDVTWPVTFVDFGTLNAAITAQQITAVGGDVDFTGTATVDFLATSDNQTYSSQPLNVSLSFRQKLTPSATNITMGVIFVNDSIEVDGDGFLLGGTEGTTYARVSGCFQPDAGGSCAPVAPLDLAMTPMTAGSRQHATFPFSPKLTGIESGTFTGSIVIANKPAAGGEDDAASTDVGYTLVTSQVFSVDPPAASLGQYVFVHGGGFVGGEADALTQIELDGTFAKDGAAAAPVSMTLIPEFVEGRTVRYVINTDDALGMALDLRKDTGHFTGTITPIITYGSDTVKGVATPASFDIAPVKQVVYLHYETAYVEELRDFGMRAVDKQIRDRILAVCNRTYLGVNIEFRTDPVTDFALFENVDLVGVDPNNMGLFGYDNSPGKDTGNMRLYDQLGGVNATTQQDGFPGYGGVFVRSLMGFSQHPGSFAQQTDGADPTFDQTFDPFRTDQGGKAIDADDLVTPVAVLTDGSMCPAKDRPTQMACAVFELGNLIGGTLAHEIGHSLGLAYPYGDGFHDNGDQPNRLMDAGGDRSYLERAEIGGQGPAVFCDDEYTYLRQILPSSSPPNAVTRPGCY